MKHLASNKSYIFSLNLKENWAPETQILSGATSFPLGSLPNRNGGETGWEEGGNSWKQV